MRHLFWPILDVMVCKRHLPVIMVRLLLVVVVTAVPLSDLIDVWLLVRRLADAGKKLRKIWGDRTY